MSFCADGSAPRGSGQVPGILAELKSRRVEPSTGRGSRQAHPVSLSIDRMIFNTRGLVKVRRAAAPSKRRSCHPERPRTGNMIGEKPCFGTRRMNHSPLGVPLGDPDAQPASIKASLKGNTLTARHEHYTIRIEVVPPKPSSENGPNPRGSAHDHRVAQANLDPFPGQGGQRPGAAYKREFSPRWAPCAQIAATSLHRIQADDLQKPRTLARTLHLPLLMFTTICGTRRFWARCAPTVTNKEQRGGASKWTERDFAQVEGYLSRMCLCTTGRDWV